MPLAPLSWWNATRRRASYRQRLRLWALWLEWYATRLALDVSGLTAAGVVVLDVTIGLFLVSITGSIS